ncbi:MAG: hypothetical protein GY705_08170 [Bacteroidetes bacterium]|nr:hypothetical protein [Bacteroidota bacterium]
MEKIRQPLTNAQLEILKAFSFNLNINELEEFKDLIAQYFAKRAIQSANKVWDEKGWGDEDVDRILDAKMRKSINRK